MLMCFMVKAKKKVNKSTVLDFGSAFSYPFNRAKGMWNALWLLLPIFGWFALGGYSVRIVKEFVDGKFKQLPVMKFGDDMKFGFFMFLKAIPFIIAYVIIALILELIPVLGDVVQIFFSLFVVPMLAINFMKKETVESFFEIDLVKPVMDNFKDYLVALLKSIGLAIIFFVMIIVLVGIPASMFTKNIFIADFYRRHVK